MCNRSGEGNTNFTTLFFWNLFGDGNALSQHNNARGLQPCAPLQAGPPINVLLRGRGEYCGGIFYKLITVIKACSNKDCVSVIGAIGDCQHVYAVLLNIS